MSAVFALAVVALATTFTSCEKEDFNVNIEPNPAMVCFTPTVIDAATNVNVTAKATITGADAITSTASDKSLPAGTATITATVTVDDKTATGTVTVNYPAVAAGQILSISPVILLSSDFNIVAGPAVNVGAPKEEYATGGDINHSHAGITWAENASDYLLDYTATWNKVADATMVGEPEILVTSVDLNAAIKDKLPVENKSTSETEGKFQASAWSLYTAVYSIQAANVVYSYTSIASGELVAKVTYYNPISYITVSPKEMGIPGHDYKPGHGHSGNPNAGGGISLAD